MLGSEARNRGAPGGVWSLWTRGLVGVRPQPQDRASCHPVCSLGVRVGPWCRGSTREGLSTARPVLGPRVAHKAHCSSHSAREAAREGPALHGSVSRADPGDRGLDKQRGPGDAGSELTFPGHCEKCLQGRGPGLRTSPHSRAGHPLPTEGLEVGLWLGDSGQVPGRRGWGGRCRAVLTTSC